MEKLHALAVAASGALLRQKRGVGALLLLLFVLVGSLPANAQAQEASLWELQLKYARILKVEADSLHNLQLYQMLDRWPDFAAKHPDKMAGQYQEMFAQYLYYLVYQTKLPLGIDKLMAYKDAYLFKNPAYLRSGDFVFFGKGEVQPDKLALYLQNDIVAYPTPDGQMKYIALREIQENYKITAAKILKDEEGTKP